MENSEVVNYIKSGLAKGESRKIIANSLYQTGWQESDVQNAFRELSVSDSTISKNETVTEKEYPITQLWVFKTPIIIVVVSIIVFFFGYSSLYYLVVALPISLIANSLKRANFHYATREKFFEVRQGVISKKQRNLPYGVIQNIFLKQDIFDRIFGLASLCIENASLGGGKGFSHGGKLFGPSNHQRQQGDIVGSFGNRVSIPGMKKDSAEALKSIFLQRMKENPIEDSQSGL